MKVLAIIPAYNEEGSIVDTVNALKRDLPEIDYIVINDGSSDNTETLCRDNGFNTLCLPVNIGLAGGFQTGMKYALKYGYDAALQFDADGQHRGDYIKPLIKAMEATDANIVIGSRFVEKKKHFSARMVGSYLIAFLIKVTTGKTIQDPTSGMRLYDKGMIELFATKHDIAPEPDTIAYALRKGVRVEEVQVEMQDRTTGESYLSFSKSITYMMRTCLSILVLQWFR